MQRRELILLRLIGEAELILLRNRSGLPALLARQFVEQIAVAGGIARARQAIRRALG